MKRLLTRRRPQARRRAPASAWLLLLVVATWAVLSLSPAPARPLGGSIALGLSLSSRSTGGPGQIYAADVEGVSTRGPARRTPSDLAALGTPRRTGLAGTWDSIRSSAVARRLTRVSSWVAGGVRLLWSIPKAVIQGDSSALIEAIGDLLSGAPGEQDKTVELPPVQIDPDPSGEPRQGELD